MSSPAERRINNSGMGWMDGWEEEEDKEDGTAWRRAALQRQADPRPPLPGGDRPALAYTRQPPSSPTQHTEPGSHAPHPRSASARPARNRS